MDFVSGMHNAGVVAATEEVANFFERQVEVGKEKIGGNVASGNQILLAAAASEVTGFEIKVLSTN